MPNRLRTKLKENEFYCLAERKRVKLPKDEIGVVVYKNKKVKGGVPALVGYSEKYDCMVHKWIKHNKKDKMIDKYGKY